MDYGTSRPLLTLAIPTYKRSAYLARLLDSLLPQLAEETRVELLISDNASPDDTPAVLARYAERGLRFRSIRNEQNIGPDRNFTQCLLEAAGRYLWIVGDDDILLPDSVALVLGLLAPGIWIWFTCGQKISSSRPGPFDRSAARVERMDDAARFARRTHVFLTFISGNIIDRERVLALPHPPFLDLAETNLIQLGWTYTALRFFRRGAYVHDPIVAVGAEDRGGYALFKVFGTNMKQITEGWLVEPRLVRIVLNGVIQVFFPGFVYRNRLQQGAFAGAPPDALLASLFGRNPRYWFFLYPLLKLPVPFARLWLLVGKVVHRVDRLLGHPLLG